MSNNNVERIKKMIEEKKKAASKQSSTNERPNQKIGRQQNAFKGNKRGRPLDK
ncbi:MAG TPA: hypothetical protein VLH18_08440 [Candidatus Limnocylindrales bacterium]|nr:hypothetical protein [Candidatus Limnocylindrales bacterium]